jgi:hypothetical protein
MILVFLIFRVGLKCFIVYYFVISRLLNRQHGRHHLKRIQSRQSVLDLDLLHWCEISRDLRGRDLKAYMRILCGSVIENGLLPVLENGMRRNGLRAFEVLDHYCGGHCCGRLHSEHPPWHDLPFWMLHLCLIQTSLPHPCRRLATFDV